MPENSTGLCRIAFIGNYVPRRCGIATFTRDLCESVAAAFPQLNCFAVPMNDRPEGYEYPARVQFEVVQNDLASYRQAADYLNINNVDLVCLQHEFGIFGGPSGSYVLPLITDLRMPVVTTLHTVLREPAPDQRRVMLELCKLSDRLVVMSECGREFLREVYGVPGDKIDVTHHGIPDVPFVDPNFYKDKFGVEGQFVLLTFGLLSENKGIEFVIEALPEILRRIPNVVFIVLGATHPHVQRREGEFYRLALERRAEALGVEQHVLFHNRFVSLEELIEFIGAADVYITPYLNPAQIVSGTLAYTVGAGKAVVSTPYWYAEELLRDGRGVLVPFRDAAAIAEQVVRLLEHDAERHAMRKHAYLLGREMVWPHVAKCYFESFERARADRQRRPRPAALPRTLAQRPGELPLVRLDHLESLSDGTGILQHSVFGVPNYHEGYTTDDNARGLVLATLLMQLAPESMPQARRLASRSLSYLWYAYHPENGRFRNFMSYDRRWLEEKGSEDSHGRALWGLGLASRLPQTELRGPANQMIGCALPAAPEFRSPRAGAFTLLGLHEYLQVFPGDRTAQHVRELLVDRLLEWQQSVSAPDWPWFEDRLSYCNAVLPHSLLVSGTDMNRPEVTELGLESLRWLMELQRHGTDHFVPIGTVGFYVRGHERARFDQQPVEAQASVSACLDAFRITGERPWYTEAKRAFEWFLGRNDLRIPLCNPVTGACRDGLHADRVNQNEGAESTLSYLIALLEMRLAEPSWKQQQQSPARPAERVGEVDGRQPALVK